MVLLHDTDRPLLPPTTLESIEPPLETKRHLYQIILLLQCLEYLWRDGRGPVKDHRTDFFAAGNLTIYYSLRQINNQDFRGPDFFVVLDTEQRDRKSWTVWEEDGKYPNVIVEILSDSTEQVDRGLKKQLYQDVFHTHEYFWFHPYTLEFVGWRLDGKQYQPIVPTTEGWLWSEELQLYLGLHHEQLRYFDADRALVPTPEEAANQAETAIAAMRQKMLDLGIIPD
jgi:Uma2 family endonuclease